MPSHGEIKLFLNSQLNSIKLYLNYCDQIALRNLSTNSNNCQASVECFVNNVILSLSTTK